MGPVTLSRVAEQFCDAGDIRLCYETFGDPADPTVLLIMGLATQMIAWPDEFCAEIAGRGFHVVRFDNRDVGHSSRVRARPPTLWQVVRRDTSAAAYTLDDMAGDAVGLLDCLGVERAHVVGASMGGMIAQVMAARHPDRVLSLVSIMSNTGHRWTGQPAPVAMKVLLQRAPAEREAFIEHMVKAWAIIGSPGFPRDDGEIRAQLERAYERGHDAAGTGRQLAAVFASGDRTAALKDIRVPTLVIHGEADKLVRISGGRRTAKSIPGARLETIPGMGHDLPRGVWSRLVDGIVDTARRAAAPTPAAG
jgi:pimeloyl-ACP methyl ester carboxylesterase